ncbi:hypothetical protein CXB51_013671 [Gossypium anomalum]|uniref:Retrotransposon Copia-like N-terminal domain-containing protein n=1 Tax=Gossypium anomalum TaxID=47600 RepID=A0A8J6CZQ8_9ROSI|nr:hypothetical protein CXB51_013671 [Gossypium anomalum]
MDSSSADSVSAITKFLNPVPSISQKFATFVNDNNFLAWKQHVLLIIKTHRLHSYIDGSITIPSRMLTSDDGVSLIGKSSSAFALWQTLTRIFGTQSATKAMHYRSLLHNFKKNEFSMSAYLAGIKHFCDSLASCNHHISLAEQQ